MEELQHKTVLGIEFGSTRIKAVLLGGGHRVIAAGGHEWENRFIDDSWTYTLADITGGLQACYKSLKENYKKTFGKPLAPPAAIGISAMMHGYMAFDKRGGLLVPFRTWRNNYAAGAAKELTKLFGAPIPARWSIAHLYRAIQNKEPHVREIAFLATLEGYIHYLLTGERVIGIGEASGMFPVSAAAKAYDAGMAAKFDALLEREGLPFRLTDILPKVLTAGECAGRLTAEGAALLDPEGGLPAGIPLCPPEGDAGTGMVATNSVRKGTGNISAGTSVFGMFVLKRELRKVHAEIDVVATPAGEPVAMVHCNNCTSEINAWAELFSELAEVMSGKPDKGELFGKLFEKALEGDADCGGLIACNYLSGEHITGVEKGRPLLLRRTESRLNLANFMRAQIYAAFATLKIGLDILVREEGVELDAVCGHGGIFKTKGVAQRFLAAAVGAPVTVNRAANEGGAFGMAVLALYMIDGGGLPLEKYLDDVVFRNADIEKIAPAPEDAAGMERFTRDFVKMLPLVRLAAEALED
jgi:sugar (pentulose or hexulose) kinase